jgi:TPR repeat protein
MKKLFFLFSAALCWSASAQTFEEAQSAFFDRNYSIAFAGFKNLADKGGIGAKLYLARMYRDGLGVPRDYSKSVAIYNELAEDGRRGGQVGLGVAYEFGYGVPVDYSMAVLWYRKAAEQDDPIGQFSLGNIYHAGRGVKQDYAQAVVWYLKAAENGHPTARINLAQMLLLGQGVSKDPAQAEFWLIKAAESGDDDAQYILGSLYFSGKDVPKNEVLGFYWLLKSAEQGNSEAQFSVGYCYFNGKGVSKNARFAFDWFKKAAEQGSSDAQFEVGAMYYEGTGTPRSLQQAFFWYRMAAEQGSVAAQNNLGVMYGSGEGVVKDDQQAYYWYLLAGANGGVRGAADAGINRDEIERRLTAQQRADAQSAARNWRPKKYAELKRINYSDSGLNGADDALKSQPVTSEKVDSTGSGVRVARGMIVTNGHVVKGCSKLNVNGIAGQIKALDERTDLALISTAFPGAITTFRAQRAAVGELISIAGYPLRGLLSGFNMTTGNVSSLSGIGGDTRLLQITAPVQPGNSGGPMLDSSGNLMGIVVSKLDAIKTAKLTGDIPQNVNFAINNNVLRSFLDANGVEYETAVSGKTIPTTVIAGKAKGFTVLVECWK